MSLIEEGTVPLSKAEIMAAKRRVFASQEMREKREALANKAWNKSKISLEEEFHGFYQAMHKNPKKFLGYSTKRHVKNITKLVEKHNAKTLLDYGCGKGMQYLGRRFHEQWGGVLPHCYDPGVRGLHKKPDGTFDGVICCDVLEHIPESLISDVLEEISLYAEKFVFANIALSPARKTLPNGQNAHVTLQPESWWRMKFEKSMSDQDVLLVFSDEDERDGRSEDE